MRISLLLTLPLAMVAACGGDTELPPDAQGRLDRPTLHAKGELPGQLATVLPIPEGMGVWKLSGREATTPERVPGERMIALEPADEPALIHVPIQVHASDMDLVRVVGVFPDVFKVTVQFSGVKGEPVRPPTLGTRKGSGAQVLLFDVARSTGAERVFREMLLLLDGPAVPVEIHSIETINAPDSQFLAEPGSPPEMTDLDSGIGFSANGLAVGTPITCSFLVEHPNDRLSFTATLSPRVRIWEGKPRIRATVSDGSDSLEVTLALEGVGKSKPRWQSQEVRLSEFVGKEVEVLFEYLCDSRTPGVAALAEVQVWRPRIAPPTVLYVSSDSHRADHIGASNLGVEIETPALDALAEGGLIFENCWSTTNVTSPSHVAMMTGIHPRDTRLVTNIDRLAPDALTLAEVYRDAGYATLAAVSVRHLGPRGTNLGQGFDRMLAPTSTPWDAEVPVDQLLTWMEQSEGKPLFMFLHLFDAHHPYAPPAAYDRKYYPEDRDPSDPALPRIEARPGAMPLDLLAGDIRDLEFPKAQYRAEVSYLDAELGRIFTHPRVAAGLIAVSADHGEILVKNGTYFNHGELYPDTLHVPLLIGGGAVPADLRGTRVRARVAQLDLPRTILDLSGLGAVEFPGRNLLGALETGESAALFALAAHGNSASLADDRWFLLLHLRDHLGSHPVLRVQHQIELFDLESDPECLVDVSADNPEVVSELRERLIKWLAESTPQGLSTKRVASAQELRALQELGYSTDAAVIEEEPWYTPEK